MCERFTLAIDGNLTATGKYSSRSNKYNIFLVNLFFFRWMFYHSQVRFKAVKTTLVRARLICNGAVANLNCFMYSAVMINIDTSSKNCTWAVDHIFHSFLEFELFDKWRKKQHAKSMKSLSDVQYSCFFDLGRTVFQRYSCSTCYGCF